MKRVEKNENWSLFCPNEAPGLFDLYGEAFEKAYVAYEQAGLARRTIPAQDLWLAILTSQVETGTPYMLYKDECNEKSNQKNLGTIRSSNLCTEVIQYTSPEEVAVCNLASINLSVFVNEGENLSSSETASKAFVSHGKYFDLEKLHQVSKVVTRNLNKVIDVNFYPVPEAETSNRRHRPIGIGVQGLADAFAKLRLPFDSQGACQLNRDIFETIYHGALEASMELAQKEGPYASYEGSPASQGILQPDMWHVVPSSRWDWNQLRKNIQLHGLRNSLLLAPMPTASTAQVCVIFLVDLFVIYL